MIRIICDSRASKGKLFEQLIAEILQKLGFTSVKLRCRQIGAEYDLEAVNAITHEDIIGECKAWDVPVSSGDLQKWLGKYVLVLSDKPNCAALFFTLSDLGSEARSLYEKINKRHPKFVVHQSSDISEILEKYGMIISSGVVEYDVKKRLPAAKLGKKLLIYSDKGFFWAQFFLRDDLPTAITLLDSRGHAISEDLALDILNLDTELKSLTYVDLSERITQVPRLAEGLRSKIVEPPKGKGWFDYYYPAAPSHFIGRLNESDKFIEFLRLIRQSQSSHRGVVIHGPSGIGKSSFVLKLQDLVKNNNCFTFAIDCRGCAGMDFFPLALDNLIKSMLRLGIMPKKAEKALPRLAQTELFGFIDKIDIVLREAESMAVVFLDQFEYLIKIPEVVRQAKDLLLYSTTQSSQVIFVFTIKSDLTIDFTDFPFDAWNIIKEQSFTIKLEELLPKDVDEFISILEKHVGLELSSALVREIKIFSKNRPWLLKRVCSYILRAHQNSELNRILKEGLRLDDLFKEDIERLNEDELIILKAMARSGGTTTIANLQSPFDSSYTRKLLNDLVTKRLVLRIGDRYDFYHERFGRYVIEKLLAREEQLQVQIDLYARLLPILAEERNRQAIRTILNTLYKFYTREKTTYRIEDITEFWEKIGAPLGYKFHELKAKAYVKMKLDKESRTEYEKAIDFLVKGKSKRDEFGRIKVAYPLDLDETISEVSRIKTDLAETDVAQEIGKIGDILKSSKDEFERFEKLSKTAPKITDKDTYLILERTFRSLDRVPRGLPIGDVVDTVRKSNPKEIARILSKIEYTSETENFVRRSIYNSVYNKVITQLEKISRKSKQSWETRLRAARWLEIMTGRPLHTLLTDEDMMPLVLERLRSQETLPENSPRLVIDMFLKQPLKHLNLVEKERFLFNLYFVWEKVIPSISQSDLEMVFDHIGFLASDRFSNIRWYAAIWLESIVDFRKDFSITRTANLLLKLASDDAPSIRRRAAEVMGRKSLVVKLKSEVREKITQKLELLKTDEDSYVRDAAYKSICAFRSTR